MYKKENKQTKTIKQKILKDSKKKDFKKKRKKGEMF